jgi:hypothetical protein
MTVRKQSDLKINTEFKNPRLVRIIGYSSHAMEPFITRNEKYLFFNSLNDGNDTSLFYAEKINNFTFKLKGKIRDINKNPPHLDAVGSMDINNVFYFISTRNYSDDYNNVFKGEFNNGSVSNIVSVKGDFYIKRAGCIVMDAEISSNGKSLYYVNSKFSGNPWPIKADIGLAHYVDKEFIVYKNYKEILKYINTDSSLEYAPSITDDELELFFTRADLRTLKPKIYISKRKSKKGIFNKPELINLSGFIEAPSISKDKKRLYFHKKENGIFKIYVVERK